MILKKQTFLLFFWIKLIASVSDSCSMNRLDLPLNVGVPERGQKIALSLSGGLDSVTLLHYLAFTVEPENTFAVSFDYNQRHGYELYCAMEQIKAAGIPPENYRVIDISFLGDIVKGVSSMVHSDLNVPKVAATLGDPQPSTYVPMRNLIFASLLAAFAESNQCSSIALGLQRTDTHGYWDTTPSFVEALQQVFNLNRKNIINIFTPFVEVTKREEVLIGTQLGVDYRLTWTGYNGPKTEEGETWPLNYEASLGHTSWRQMVRETIERGDWPYADPNDTASADRRTAFKRAGLVDPIQYLPK